MNICVFCSMFEVGEPYESIAREFGKLIGEKGHTLVWGGSDRGLMKTVAASAQEAGARLVGITFERIKYQMRENIDEVIVTKELPERKEAMLEHADVFVMLIGGIGTIDEVTEILEYEKEGVHHKPVIVLNTDGFYDGLKMQLERMEQEKFLPRPLAEFLVFKNTPQEAMEYIDAHGS